MTGAIPSSPKYAVMTCIGTNIPLVFNTQEGKEGNGYFNPLNAELNPICYLLALLEAHHIFQVSGLRVKLNRSGAVLAYSVQVSHKLCLN